MIKIRMEKRNKLLQLVCRKRALGCEDYLAVPYRSVLHRLLRLELNPVSSSESLCLCKKGGLEIEIEMKLK